jgi:hypothetical protein
MRHRYLGGALLAAVAFLAGPSTARAQVGGEGGGFPPPLNADGAHILPTGRAGDAGFYGAMEFVMLAQTRAIGNQTIATRGFYDITGQLTGTPGAFVGDNTVAISTSSDFLGRRTMQPGFNLEIGYRFSDSTRVFVNYMQLYDAHYSVGASTIPPFFDTRLDLANTFLSAPVFNFNSQFSGPANKVAGVPSLDFSGVWNAATQMDIKFTQRFQQLQAGVRVPVLQSEYSRVYSAAGFQFDWFFERFFWRSVSQDVNGIANPQDAARYTNTLSQRMYGPFVGCGHEIFIHNQFSLSLDLTGALLLAVEKQRAKYILEDETVQSKWGREDFRLVPNANAAVNLWWYPIEGVQMRVGYQILTFYNTLYMDQPVGFNYGSINPGYNTQEFRLLHGFNVGIGFFF